MLAALAFTKPWTGNIKSHSALSGLANVLKIYYKCPIQSSQQGHETVGNHFTYTKLSRIFWEYPIQTAEIPLLKVKVNLNVDDQSCACFQDWIPKQQSQHNSHSLVSSVLSIQRFNVVLF